MNLQLEYEYKCAMLRRDYAGAVETVLALLETPCSERDVQFYMVWHDEAVRLRDEYSLPTWKQTVFALLTLDIRRLWSSLKGSA